MAHAADLPAANLARSPAGERITFEELCTKRFMAIRQQERGDPGWDAEYLSARKEFERGFGAIDEEAYAGLHRQVLDDQFARA